MRRGGLRMLTHGAHAGGSAARTLDGHSYEWLVEHETGSTLRVNMQPSIWIHRLSRRVFEELP